MKVSIPLAEDKTQVCVSFGRAPFMLFRDAAMEKTEIAENPGAQAQGGTGIKAAQFVVDNGADVLITVRCGQNAADVFHAAGIKIYKSIDGTAEENLNAFAEGKLEVLTHFHAGFHGIQ